MFQSWLGFEFECRKNLELVLRTLIDAKQV